MQQEREPAIDGTQTDFIVFESGCLLTPDAVESLEDDLHQNPSDTIKRLKLLGFYTFSKHGRRSASDWLRHMAWMIENCPSYWISGHVQIPDEVSESEIERLSQLWLAKVAIDPDSAAIAGRAAQFMIAHDPALAERLLIRSEQLQPDTLNGHAACFHCG
ncbi:MAG: hypothetical protein U0105_00330 [Candidatus Obscuribacterales bacterium]